MSTIMHPCFESQFVETSQVLKLKVAGAPQPKGTEQVGWTFLESLSNISSNTKESIYIHPLSSKSTSPRLSDKSLQICTENLGCETGSFVSMDINILSLSSDNNYYDVVYTRKDSHSYHSIKKVKSCCDLPPPLTTMSGEKQVQVKTYRENGRLIIKSVEKPVKESCFLADRSTKGSLKLCFLKQVFDKVDMRMIIPPCENEVQEDANINKNDVDKNEEFPNQEAEDEDEDYNGTALGNNNNSNNNNYAMENIQRVKRCKECGNNNQKKLCNWEPLWVATS